VHPAVHSIEEVVHDDRNWTCTPFSSLFTEPTGKKRKIDEWILSFPRHQNNDPPLSGPFACWRRRSVHVQAHTLAGDLIPANPGTCESCSVGAAAAGALSYQLNQISGSRLSTSSKHALLLENPRSGGELHHANSRLVPRVLLSIRYRLSRNRISYCSPRYRVEIQEFEIVMHAPEDTLDFVLP
jgi:hypothetical protein